MAIITECISCHTIQTYIHAVNHQLLLPCSQVTTVLWIFRFTKPVIGFDKRRAVYLKIVAQTEWKAMCEMHIWEFMLTADLMHFPFVKV